MIFVTIVVVLCVVGAMINWRFYTGHWNPFVECRHHYLLDDEMKDGEPTGGWIMRCEHCGRQP